MSRIYKLCLAAALAAGSIKAEAVQAQTAPPKWADTLSSEIDKAAISGDLTKIVAARSLAERVAVAFPNDGLILHYHAFALYREASAMLAMNAGNALLVFQRAQTIFERSLKLRPLAETHALMSSIDGQLISADPSRGMELGMASNASISAALALGTNNPRVWMIRGIGSMYTPAEYGGGLDHALEQLKRAADLFGKDAPKPGEPSWGRPEVHVWLGQVYEKQGNKTSAAAEYKAALAVAPEYTWAKGLLAALK